MNHSGEGLNVGQAVQETQNSLLPCKFLELELRWKPDPYLITVSRHAAHPYITNAPYLIRLEHVQDDAIVRVGEVGVAAHPWVLFCRFMGVIVVIQARIDLCDEIDARNNSRGSHRGLGDPRAPPPARRAPYASPSRASQKRRRF